MDFSKTLKISKKWKLNKEEFIMTTECYVNEVLKHLNRNRKPDNQVKLKINEVTGDYEFENPGDKNYDSVCYLIALNVAIKAAKLQMDNDVTGFQHGYIVSIINTLINDRLFEPIEDCDDEWTELRDFGKDGNKEYQAKRYTALFKTVKPDGVVAYNDVNRFAGRDGKDGPCWSGRFADIVGEKVYGPITLPYMPKPTIIFDSVSFDSKNAEIGCYDTICFYDVNGQVIFYDDGGKEITKDEFLGRYNRYCTVAKEKGYNPVEIELDRINKNS